MSQDQMIILCLKIALVAGFVSLTGWVAQYTALTRGRWRHNPIGRTLVVKTLLIAGLFVPTALGLFFNLTPTGSRIAGWADVALIGAVTPVMLWRIRIFFRLYRQDRLPRNGNDGGGSAGGAG